ncbi:Fc.00g023290.m01.CDS01 [Cosmosporella sp. VM-42]
MKELKQCGSRRRPLAFDKLHLDQPDEFYELHFSKVFVEIYTLVEANFCPPRQSEWTKISPWLRQYPESFNKYIELLAHPDPYSGKWDRLLRVAKERSFLLQAMIMKVLDTQVLSNLLFGADPEHTKILQSDDASYVNAEGFRRSNHRAQTNSMYLEARRGLPPLFWDEVDRLTTRLVAMLLPAYTLVAESAPWHPPPVQQLYQSLHDVVAYAGWLNVCMRLSPSIIVTEWPKPGERMQLHGQENLSQELYEFSLQNAQKYAKRNPRLKSNGFHSGWMARVKISVTPQITRHTPSDEPNMEGMTAYTVMKPHVVYYQGRFNDNEERQLFISRSEYVRRLRNRKTVPHAAALVVMLLGLLMLWMLYADSEQRVWHWWKQGISPTPETWAEPEPEPEAEPNGTTGLFGAWGSHLGL